MPPDDPVLDAGPVTDRGPVTDTPVVDRAGITTPADRAAQNAAAKPAVGTLYLYDSSIGEASARAVRDAFYPGATLRPMTTFADLTRELGRYSSIGTLVIDTHSAPGNLLLARHSPDETSQRESFAASGVTVTDAIVFEGCRIMGNPAATAALVSDIAGPGVRLSGYTLYSVVQSLTLTLTGTVDAAMVEAELEPHALYLLPGGPTPAELAGTTGEVTYFKRWFRADYVKTPVPPVSPGTLPPRGIHVREDMSPVTVSTPQQAQTVRAEATGPVPRPYYVTVDDVPAVATPPPKSEDAEDAEP